MGHTASQVIELVSGGTTTINISALTTSPGPFRVSASPVHIEPGTAAPVVVTFAPLVMGDYLRSLSIVSNDPVRPASARKAA